jgi:hypothetical protein
MISAPLPSRHHFDTSTTIELISEIRKGFMQIVEINSAGGAGGGAEGLQACGKRVKNARLDREEVEFAFAPDEDNPRGFKFLDVVRECGWCDSESLACVGATEWAVGSGYALEQFESLGIGKGLEDCSALGAVETQRPSRFQNSVGRSKIFFHSHGV